MEGLQLTSIQYNGRPMSIYLKEDETRRCSGYLEDIRGRPLINKPAPRSGNPAIVYARKATSFAAAWIRILASSWQSPGSPSSSRWHRNTSDDSDTAQRLESHLLIENYSSSTHDTKMLTLGAMERMQDDFELFVRARRLLGGAEGSWTRHMLPWSYHEVVLSRVGLKSGLMVKILTTAQFNFPSSGSDKVEATNMSHLSDLQDICGGYEFKSPDGAAIDIHMRLYAHILLEGIRYPEIGRGSRTLLDRIPKLRLPIGVDKDAMNYGWGFHVSQSLSIPKIMSWIFGVMVLGLIFVPFFAPLSLVTIVFTLFILWLGAHTELRL